MDKAPIDIAWVVISAGLVFLMQAGFLCLETGLTRSKNSINVAIKNIADFAVSAFLFWLFGFALMFGVSAGGWIGTTGFFTPVGQGNTWLAAFFVFQAMFCGTATTIVSGAVAERMRFRGYILVSVILSGLIYTVYGHWAWGGAYEGSPGWLARLGFVDFAGSTVVHSVGGWVALAVVLVIGPRKGRFPHGEPPRKIHGHNLPMAMLGVLLLWLGWLGFNGGSTLALDERVPRIIANTVLAGCTGLLTVLAINWRLRGRPDVRLIMNGALAGLVAITANCHAVTALGAVIIGGIGGLVMLAVTWLLERLRIDDVVGAIPVHAAAGVWGTLAVALFADLEVLGTGLTRSAQLGVQFLGVSVCFLWAFGLVYLVFRFLNPMFPLRVSPDDEQIGLNIAEHGASTDILDLFRAMEAQAKTGDLGVRVPVEPFTEIGQIATRYNLVMEALQKAVAKTEAIVRTAADAIITFSTETLAITSVNPRTETIFGYSQSDMLGRPIYTLLESSGPATHASGSPSFHTLFLESRKNVPQRVKGKRADGTTFPMEFTVSKAVLDELPFYAGTFRDISEQERYEENLRNAKSEAEIANRTKSQFLANMSHEIRTPMNAIIGYTEMLQEDAEESGHEGLVADLGKIRHAGDHLLSLINNILDLAKIESGKMGLYLETVDVPQLLQLILSTVQPLVRKNGNTLIVNCPDDLGSMQTDVTKVRQSLFNLISNACKFTEHGTITLTVSREATESGDWFTMSIADTGVGIAPEMQEEVFELFKQVDDSTTKKYGGTGLGLAISQQFCRMLGGDLTVESHQGQGSTFTIRLPAVAQGEPPEFEYDSPMNIDTDPLAPPSRGAGTILVIDDDPAARELMHRFLQKEGFNVVLATSGEDGLIKAREIHPDAITLDVIMPGMDGWMVLQELKADQELCEIPVIVVSMVDDQSMGYAMGASEYLTKPLDRQRLRDILRKYRCSSPPCSVLLVEDDEETRIVMRRSLEKEGWMVAEAENGQAALDRMAQNMPDLILLDLMMPVMNGFEFLMELRSSDAGRLIPVVVLTAKDLSAEEHLLLTGHVNHILQKGAYSREELLHEVRRLMAECVSPADR